MPAVQPRPTLADVARLAGVSAKTVSRVYSDPETVSPETSARVRSAAERLQFRPNLLARQLRHGGLTRTVAFVTAELLNPFTIEVASGIEEEFAAQGYTMLLATTDDAGEREVIDAMFAQRVRSLLLIPVGDDHSYLEGERRLGTVVVAIDRPVRNLLADSVVLANREGCYQATQVLLRHGHRRIAFVCNPVSVYSQQERLIGYRKALIEAGIADDQRWERVSDDRRVSLESLVEAVLDSTEPPTALVGGNNLATAAALRVLKRRGQDLALIGFDDFSTADLLDVSVIAHDPVEMGRTAARLALKRLEDPTGVTSHIEMPVHYVARGSAEKPPA
ncbi:MAG: LacI family DNA-binding transcriptional regulator [Propionicimonas sp.]